MQSRSVLRHLFHLGLVFQMSLLSLTASFGDSGLKGEVEAPAPISYVASIEHLIAACGTPLRLFEISPADGTVLREIPIPPGFQDVGDCGMTLVGSELHLGGTTGLISVVDLKTGQFLRSFPAPFDQVDALGHVPERGTAAGGTIGDETPVAQAPVFFSPADGEVLATLTDPDRKFGMAGGPLGHLFAWNDRDRVIELVDQNTGDRLGSISAEEIFVDTCSGLGFTGRLLFVSEPENRLIKQIDLRTGQIALAFPAPLSPVCALAAGPDEPSLRYLRPDDLPILVSGGIRAAAGGTLTSGKLMLDWPQSESTETFEVRSFDYSGEHRDEFFGGDLNLEDLPTNHGVFHLYALGTDDQQPARTTDKETALSKQFTLVLDANAPTVVVVQPKTGDILNEADLPEEAEGFPVIANISEDLSGLALLELYAKAEGQNDFILQSTLKLDGETDLLHEFVWNPSGSGVYTLSVIATDRSGNQGEFTVQGVQVLLDVEPTPTPGHPVGVEAELLFDPEGLFGEVYSSITIAELDGDREPELVFGTDRTNNSATPELQTDIGMGLFAINLDGSPVAGSWPVILDGDVRSSPAAADLDGDGLDEIAVGAYPRGLYIFDHDGTELAYVPTLFSVISSPAIGNLDDDRDLEVVVGTSDATLIAVNRDGTAVTGWPVTPPRRVDPLLPRNDIDSSPALGDITGDGHPEVVVLSDDGVVYAYHHTGQPVPGFPFAAPRETFSFPVPVSANSSSPLLSDVDGDGVADVVIGMTNGRVYALNGSGQLLPGYPLRLPPGSDPTTPAGAGDDILSTPVVADVDGDGLLELGVVFHSGLENRSRLYLYDLHAPAVRRTSPWPTFQGDSLRTGFSNGTPNGDFNRDGVIDRRDVEAFREGWHKHSTMPGYHPTNDFDFSGKIDGVDLPEFLESHRVD